MAVPLKFAVIEVGSGQLGAAAAAQPFTAAKPNKMTQVGMIAVRTDFLIFVLPFLSIG